MKFLLFIFLLTIVKSIILPHDGELIQSQMPEFDLDLNIEPFNRWAKIIPTYKTKMQKFIEYSIDSQGIPDEFFDNLGNFIDNHYKYKDFVEEVKGIAYHAEIRWEKVLFGNFFYEFSKTPMCTSILVKNKFNKILHSRNLDFPYWRFMSQTAAKINVYRGSRFIGVWEQMIGSVLVLSGYNPGLVSLTVDARYTTPLEDIIVNLFEKQYIPSCYLSRMILENELYFSIATEKLITTDTTAPIYYILGGSLDGVVIEKDPIGVKAVHDFESADNWYMVQTNLDWDQQIYDIRRNVASLRLEKIGQDNINEQNLFELMTEYPTLNIASIYSLLFSVEYSYDTASLWYGNVYTKNQKEQMNDFKEFLDQQEENNKRIQQFVNIVTEKGFFDKIIQKIQQE